MPPVLKRFLPALALLVVGCAQVFGLQQGYVCAHQELVLVTASDHCHRIDTGVQSCAGDCASQSDKDKGEDSREPHAPAGVEMNGTTVLPSISIPAYIAVIFALLPPCVDWNFSLALSELPANGMSLDTGEKSTPAAVQVSRCMVILV